MLAEVGLWKYEGAKNKKNNLAPYFAQIFDLVLRETNLLDEISFYLFAKLTTIFSHQ